MGSKSGEFVRCYFSISLFHKNNKYGQCDLVPKYRKKGTAFLGLGLGLRFVSHSFVAFSYLKKTP